MFGAALDAVSPSRLLRAPLLAPDLLPTSTKAQRLRLLAIGKAAPWLAEACVELLPGRIDDGLVVGTHCPISLSPRLRWHQSSHPVPDARSVAAAEAALQQARSLAPDEHLLVLISGGASALVALPRPEITLDDKRATTRLLLRAGADITALNTVRKHLSSIKGGRLGVAARRATALAVSDVVGDDLGVIASGPTVADPTTFADAMDVIERHGGAAAYPPAVVDCIRKGIAGRVEETPKPGDPRLHDVRTSVVGSGRDAAAAASAAAASRGYHAVVLPRPLVGEARLAGRFLVEEGGRIARGIGRPACIVAFGETTVQVAGDGRGGRNQELALGAALALDETGIAAAVLSGGTDGVDGPTDAAGAVADTTTIRRARERNLDPHDALRRNDAYPFFAALGDLLMTGPTPTNVGDVQILLLA